MLKKFFIPSIDWLILIALYTLSGYAVITGIGDAKYYLNEWLIIGGILIALKLLDAFIRNRSEKKLLALAEEKWKAEQEKNVEQVETENTEPTYKAVIHIPKEETEAEPDTQTEQETAEKEEADLKAEQEEMTEASDVQPEENAEEANSIPSENTGSTLPEFGSVPTYDPAASKLNGLIPEESEPTEKLAERENAGDKFRTKKILVQYLNDSIPPLEYIENKSDWIDLRAAKEYNLLAGGFQMIHLGVAMKLPKGYEAHIVPRSSTFNKYGLIQTNHMGVIDESYCGPEDWWKMPVYATRNVTIPKGARICQFRIIKHQPRLSFQKANLDGSNRGGFGSTGEM